MQKSYAKKLCKKAMLFLSISFSTNFIIYNPCLLLIFIPFCYDEILEILRYYHIKVLAILKNNDIFIYMFFKGSKGERMYVFQNAGYHRVC